MNKKGQGALEYLILIGGAVLVAAVIIAIISIASVGERWEEEKVCTLEVETGNLINCREETLNKVWTVGTCEDLYGEEWHGEPYVGCLKKEIVCEKEMKCVLRTPQECLIRTTISDSGGRIKTRLCDQGAE